MMNQNAIQWVTALRSNKYKQGRGTLHNEVDDTYCCLGVGCDLMAKSPEGHKLIVMSGTLNKRTQYGGFSGLPPHIVLEWLGINMLLVNTLISMNDSQDKNFSQIADYIEEVLNQK